MADLWWYLLSIVVVAVGGWAYLRMRRDRAKAGRDELQREWGTSHDYTQERETGRLANLSAEDQAWEAASLQRHRDGEDRDRPA
jgi:hypothetical protein